jgi:predicted ATPase
MSLFTLQAMESRNAFELRDSDVAVVAEICRRLDGNPLAIELAADCMDALPLRTLLAQLDDVLTLRTRGRRTAAPRHRSLRALLDWSHETLSPMEQVAWRRLAVIAGSFDLESAQAVLVGEGIDAGDVLDVMTELAAKSLLTTRVSGAQALFTLPYMSRAYALEKLESSEDSSAVRLRYAQLCGQWYRTPLIVQSD